MSPRKINLAIIETLKEEALKAAEVGHYLEAGIILFQTVEVLLRLVIKLYGRGNSVPELSLTRASDEEQNFSRLVMHLDLVYPGNELAERLRALNKDRNALIHRLFSEFESLDSVKENAKQFCADCIDANHGLGLFIGFGETSPGSDKGGN